MGPEVPKLFVNIEQLMRLMLLCPVSSGAAERSFSVYAPSKNWLRSTMTPQRLNSVVVPRVNKDIADTSNMTELAADFVQRSDIKIGLSGSSERAH